MDKLSANIENQTEILEKVCKFLAAKENIDIPPSHPVLDVKLWECIVVNNTNSYIMLHEPVSEKDVGSSRNEK